MYCDDHRLPFSAFPSAAPFHETNWLVKRDAINKTQAVTIAAMLGLPF